MKTAMLNLLQCVSIMMKVIQIPLKDLKMPLRYCITFAGWKKGKPLHANFPL
jgi:hypothetical protein